MISKVEQGSPKDLSTRSENERYVYAYLDSLKIPFQRVDHSPLTGMEGYGEISTVLNVNVAKNLFLANRQQTEFYLLMMPGDKKFKTKELSPQLKTARLSFGNEEALKKLLHAEKGYCSVLDLVYDKENQVQLLIDEDLLKEDKVGVHPCINTSTISLSWKDILEKFLPSILHNYLLVTLKEEE